MAHRPYESPALARPRRALAVLAAAMVFAVAGCGASSSGVKATADTTVVAESTTTVEEATTTVEDTTTTEAPTTTEETSTTTKSNDGWPEAAKDSFMKSCTSGSDAMKPTCECVLRGIEPVVSVSDLMDVGTSGSLPADMQSLIEDYAKKCAADPEAF